MCNIPQSGKTLTACLLKSTPKLQKKFSAPIIFLFSQQRIQRATVYLNQLGSIYLTQPDIHQLALQAVTPHFILLSSLSHQSYLSAIFAALKHVSVVCFDDSLPIEAAISTTSSKATLLHIGLKPSIVKSTVRDENGILTILPQIMVCRDSERTKAILQFVKNRRDAISRESQREIGDELLQESEMSASECKGSSIVRIVADGKREREKLLEGCVEYGISAEQDDPSLQEVSVKQSEVGVEIVSALNKKHHDDPNELLRIIFNSPRSFDEIIQNFTYSAPNLQQLLMVSHKEYLNKRATIFSEFFNGVGLHRWLMGIKQTPLQEKVHRFNCTDLSTLLGTNRRFAMSWLFRELHFRRMMNVLGTVPSAINLEFSPAVSSKSLDPLLTEVMANTQPVAGKYRICLLSAGGVPEETIKRHYELKTAKDKSEFEIISKRVFEVLQEFIQRKNRKLISFEVTEETLFLETGMPFTESDIMKLITLRSLVETELIEQVILSQSSLI